MAKDKELIELIGKVEEVLPNSTFKVRVENAQHTIICYIGGKLKQHKIKVILGDKVKIEVSSYDLTKGRIIFRL
jgi:translation initiation factor IF-1